MPGDQLFDTNILIYAFAAGDPRSAKAKALMGEGGVIGVQVLDEFTNYRGLPLMRVAACWSLKTCGSAVNSAG